MAWNTPALSSPSNGGSSFTGALLNWNSVSGSQQYQVQIDTSSSFNSPLFFNQVNGYINSSSGNSDTQLFITDLLFGQTYYWRVRAYIPNDTSSWNQRFFTTQNNVALNSPSNGSTGFTGVAFNWNAHTGVDFYDIEVDTSLSFNSPAFKSGTETYINSASGNGDTDFFFDNLFFGETYYWRVRARNAADTSDWNMRTYQTSDIVTLNSPSNNATGFTGVSFNWNAHTGVDFYDIEVDTSLAFNSPALKTGTENYINSASGNGDTDFFFDNLLFGETYYWRVRARNAVDTSSWTMRTYQTLDLVSLNSPSNNNTGFTGVSFNWNAHTGVDFYDIEVDTSLSFNSPAFKTGTEAYINSASGNGDTDFYFDNLYFGETYYWRVRARNAVDTTAWNMRTYQTLPSVTLNSPSNNATGFTGVSFNWNAHTGVDFYDIEIDTSLSFNSPAFKTGTENYINSSSGNGDTDFFFDNLLFGATYYWRVRARNAVDTSAWTMRTYFTLDGVNLNSPTNNSTGFTGTTFNWNAHTGVDFYDIQIDTSLNFNSPAFKSGSETYFNSSSSNGDTDFFFDNLYFGETYYWRVRARNAVDTSGWTMRTYQTQPTVAVNSPTNNSSGFTGRVFNWNAHTGVDFYDIELDTSLTFSSPAYRTVTETYINSSSSNGDTDAYFSDLYFGELYYWRVRARNAVDTSDWSPVRFYTTIDGVSLSTPSNNTTNVPVTGTTLNWNSHHGVVAYQMQLDSTSSFNSPGFLQVTNPYINTSSANSDTRSTTGALGASTIYNWRVRAYNNVDTSSWTTWFFSTGVPITVPAVPILISPSNGNPNTGVSVTLDWNSAANAQTYTYEYSTSPTFASSTSATVTPTNSPAISLAQNTTYYWRVLATNGSFNSVWSEVWSFNTGCNLSVPSASGATVCAGDSTTLTASGGLDFVWYDQIGGTPIATGNTLNTGSLAQTTDFFVTSVVGSCESQPVQVTVTIASTPVPTAPGVTTCAGTSAQLTASGGAGYNWYNQIGGTPVGTGSVFNTAPLSANDTFYVSTVAGSCESQLAAVFVTTVTAPAPSAANVTVCPGDPAVLAASGGSNYVWYDQVGGSPISTSNPFTTTSLSQTDTFYVATVVGACESALIPVVANVTATPTPSAIGTTVCAGDSTQLTATGGNDYVWYDQIGGTAIANTPNLNTGPLAQSTTFYVATVVGTCESPLVSVVVNVAATPVPTASGVTVCEGDSAQLSASGGSNYAWYDQIGGNPIGTGPTFTTPPTFLNDTFYVSTLAGNCESALQTVIVNVTISPPPTPSTPNIICEGEPAILSAFGATDYLWYSQIGGPVLSNQPGYTAFGLTQDDTFYVASLFGNCVSSLVPVPVTVNPVPSAPVISQVGSDSLTATGSGTFQWFLNGLPIAGNSATIFANQSGIYTASLVSANGCNSDLSTPFTFVFVGIDLNRDLGITAYPNPNQGRFTLDLPTSSSDWDLRLVNMMGQVIWEGKVDAGSGSKTALDFPGLTKGNYLLICQQQGGVQHLRIQVQ